MQEGTLVRMSGRTLVVKAKNDQTYSYNLDETCKITVTPVGDVEDVVAGDGVKFSGQPPTEVIVHRQFVPPKVERAPAEESWPTWTPPPAEDDEPLADEPPAE